LGHAAEKSWEAISDEKQQNYGAESGEQDSPLRVRVQRWKINLGVRYISLFPTLNRMDPLELLIIGAVILVVLIMGPKKVPELARSLGQAKKIFQDAKNE
jgi:TatA/E family protein of Tat protein translocase